MTGPLLHQCDGCDRRAPWDVRWRWFGSYRDLEAGSPVTRLCSPACLPLARAKGGRFRSLPALTDDEAAAWTRAAAVSDLAAQVAQVVERDGHQDQASAARAVGRTWQCGEFQLAVAEARIAGLLKAVRRRRTGTVELQPVPQASA